MISTQVEPLCAVALAALYDAPELFRGMKDVVVVVCGGSLVSLDDVNAWRAPPEAVAAVDVPGCGSVPVSRVRVGVATHVTLDWAKLLGKLPFTVPFCGATVDDAGTIRVSGTIGVAPPTAGGPVALVRGGPRAEAFRAMELVEAALRACGAGPEHIVMAHVYLVDNTADRFAEMNAGYVDYFGDRPLPARITVGAGALALGAAVEVDVVAKI